MTKKDYTSLAKVITQLPTIPERHGDVLIVKAELLDRMADWLEADNARFNRVKFIESCER